MKNKKLLPKNVYVIHKNRKYPRILFIFPDNSRVSFRVRSDVKTAEEIVRQIRRQLDLGTFRLEDYIEVKERTPTLSEFQDEYLSRRTYEYEQGLISIKTLQMYKDAFRKAVEIFGRDIKLIHITEHHVEQFIQTLQEQTTYRKGLYSSYTIATYLRHLRSAFNWAIKRGYITRNPFAAFHEKIKITSSDIRYYTPEQIALIDEWFDKYGKRWHKEAFHFCLSTGIRAESIINININKMRKEMINGRLIYFLQVTEKGRARHSRKTRWVPLLYEAPAILESRLAILQDPQAIRAIAYDGITNEKISKKYIQRAEAGYIFFEVSNVHTVTHIISRIKRDLPELGDLNWHSTRHTFALRALEDGVPLEIVSEILGHSSIQDTRSMYLKHIPPRSLAKSLSWTKIPIVPEE